jgi:hypothetical protein
MRALTETALAKWIDNIKRTIAKQEYYLRRVKRPEAETAAARRFLDHLKAKLNLLERDLAKMRAGKPGLH